MKSKTGKITKFWDMHSGGYLKTPYTHIYIDEPLDKALITFKDLFQINPDDVACECCGANFVYEEYDSLEAATEYERCKIIGAPEWVSVEKYFSGDNKVLFITE